MLESSIPVCKRHCDELSDRYCISKSRPERSRYFKVGDRVIARDYKGKDHKWIGGQIESSDGPLMYKVNTDLGSTWRRHVDQIKPSKIAEDITQNTPVIEEPSVETTENTMTEYNHSCSRETIPREDS